jgi:hypothetical protein
MNNPEQSEKPRSGFVHRTGRRLARLRDMWEISDIEKIEARLWNAGHTEAAMKLDEAVKIMRAKWPPTT